MNITLLCVYPNYFNATGLCQALERHCGHIVTQFLTVDKSEKKFYNWPLHHRHYDLHDMPMLKECLKLSDLVIVCGVMTLLMWEKHSKLPIFDGHVYKDLDAFQADIPKAKTALIVSDSAILEQDWTERISMFDTVLAMPDLFDYVDHPKLYPALQVNDVFEAPQPTRDGKLVVIGHSPGNKKVKDRKGTSAIIDVLSDVRKDDFDFRFEVIFGLSHDECIRRKQGMDIFIDQLQDPPKSTVGKGMPPFLGALGKSGQEGMCNGCATITSGNLVSTRPYFPDPPVIIANTRSILKYEIENLLRHPQYRFTKALEQHKWAERYLNPNTVSRYIMECIK